MLRADTFPLCCGATNIFEFPHEVSGDATETELEQVKQRLEHFASTYSGAFLLLILTENQRRNFKKVVYDAGWRRKAMGNNGGDGRNLYLYVRIQNELREDRVMED